MPSLSFTGAIGSRAMNDDPPRGVETHADAQWLSSGGVRDGLAARLVWARDWADRLRKPPESDNPRHTLVVERERAC